MKKWITKMEKDFLKNYKNFKDFQFGDNKAYWDLCIESLKSKDFISYMINANDLNKIPPVKSFLLYYEKEVLELNGKSKYKLSKNIKQAMGAFYGMFFKNVLNYKDRKTISITMNQKFNLVSASTFIK